MITERSDDWNSHPEPDLFSHHDGSHGGHRVVHAQL
jgi:hypothetical protein